MAYECASKAITLVKDKHDILPIDALWFVQELIIIFISLTNPYYLIDVPMVKTYINHYSSTDKTIDAKLQSH